MRKESNIVTLGEGYTPILRGRRLEEEFKHKLILIKDDGMIPTGTFKARGQSTAISGIRAGDYKGGPGLSRKRRCSCRSLLC